MRFLINSSSFLGVAIFPLTHILPDLKGIAHANALCIGKWNNKMLFAISLDSLFPISTSSPFHLIHGRDLLSMMDKQTAHVLCCAKQLLHWHLTSLYCGACGHATVFSENEVAKHCPQCSRLIFPSTHPAVIVLIIKEDHILLARSPRFPNGMYSTPAGFVDPGESLEAAVHREIQEELGIRVKDVTFFGSQAWPFPNSLMIGFKAHYKSGELLIDDTEIEDAGWYSRSELPLLHPKSSIARWLIDSALENDLISNRGTLL